MAQEGKESRKEDVWISVASLYQDENGLIEWKTIEKVLEEEGLYLEKDPRMKKLQNKVHQIKSDQCKDTIQLSLFEFKQVLAEEEDLLCQALVRSLIIKEFRDFSCNLKKIYENAQDCCSGEIKKRGAVYEVYGGEWCVSVVSIDGQKVSFGCKPSFTLDELCGPLIHGLAIDLLGEDRVNELAHEAPHHAPDTRPDKAQHSSGGSHISWFLSDLAMILMCSKIKSTHIEGWTEPMKHDYVLSYIKGLCCGEDLRFSNASYSQAKESDCQSKALAHFLKAFAKTKSLVPHIDAGLDLILQLKSMEITTDSLAMIGAVLANGGVSPFDGHEILTQKAVTGLLNAMYSGGFGKTSTLFAVQGGVPGLCTESGAMLIVIPGVLGMGLFSPRVECCCSVRSYNFAMELIKTYGLHPYCKLEEQVSFPKDGKIKKEVIFEKDPLWCIFFAASRGDLQTCRRYIDDGVDIFNLKDASGLTLLHIAAAHGHLELARTLFCKVPDLLFTIDSWGRRASDYAKALERTEVADYLLKLETATRSSFIATSLEPGD